VQKGSSPLKYFFSSTVGFNSDANIVSNRSIKEYIGSLIEGEDPRKPLSDSALLSILSSKGIVLARRTVAKYRKELGLPSSFVRGK
jgi:RNA polymerase sigma-54 factor